MRRAAALKERNNANPADILQLGPRPACYPSFRASAQCSPADFASPLAFAQSGRDRRRAERRAPAASCGVSSANRRQQRGSSAELRGLPALSGPRGPAQSQTRERRARNAAPPPREVVAVEKAPDAKRALVIGDFMAAALAKGLAEAYRENPNVVVIDAKQRLVRPRAQRLFTTGRRKLPEIVSEQKPDAILVMIGANDRQAIDGDPLELRQRRMAHRLYRARRRACGRAEGDRQADPLGRSRAGRPERHVARLQHFNGIVREQLDAKGVRFVDMWNGFADEEGKYVSVGPDVRGQSVQLQRRRRPELHARRAAQARLFRRAGADRHLRRDGTAARVGDPAQPLRRHDRAPHRPDGAARCAEPRGRRRRSRGGVAGSRAGQRRGDDLGAARRRMRRRRPPAAPIPISGRRRAARAADSDLAGLLRAARRRARLELLQLAADDRGAVHHRLHLPERHFARQVFQPAIRRDDDLLRRHVGKRPADARGDGLRRFDAHVGEIEHTQMIVFPGSLASTDVSRFDCAVSIEICFSGVRKAPAGRNSLPGAHG